MQKPRLAKYYGEPFDLIDLENGCAAAKLRQKPNQQLFTVKKLERRDFRKLYVCSPLSAPTEEGISANMFHAQQYMMQISKLFGCRAIAPHEYLPYLLDDRKPNERAMAMAFDKKLLFICDAIVICGDTITRGMGDEIACAAADGKPVIHPPFWVVDNWSVEL